MSPIASTIVSLFSFLTILSHGLVVVLVGLVAAQFVAIRNKSVKKMINLISENYVVVIFVISAVATMGSLSFSEIASFTPCKLCWFQRIAMYPVAVISLVSLIKNDNAVRKYIVPLSVIGLLIAGYHILVQMFPQALECSDEVAKCSAREFAQYGYITIPVMSFTAFLLILLVSFISSRSSK